ncbi:hypothetical protein NYR54_14465 [Chelativorans sp. SCAU2101]|uniref:Uncharacterized protein n=1 Tax=Chelativorans petroleitrophicus TaxID=2975484 RepID=A0A9X2X9Y4_9HYPH|nr:hypothetical protein [Chelativorans petroleitrophicus]MCT8991483.1 hypothetical protein [Chelativorans petroleitrophicus]
MRLVTFQEIGSSEARLGALSPADKVIDLQERHRALFGGSLSELASMLALIEGGPAVLDLARSLAASEGEELSIGKDVRLLAPIPLPPQIRDSMNFLGHLVNAIDGRNRRNGVTERTKAQ